MTPLPDNNPHETQESMCLAGFDTAIKASEQQQTQVLDRAATGADHY